jgi:hypothetical protein
MSVTREFFEAWLKENVGGLPAERTASPAVLAQQFEQDADAAGYGREVRDEEIGNIEDAIREAIGRAQPDDGGGSEQPDGDLLPVIETLDVDDPKSGP